MRKFNITLSLAVAAFAVTASGCENVPTQPAADVAAVAATTSNAQSQVTLCHRSSDGEYVKITIADAAYDTHVEHGDRATYSDGECPQAGFSRLEVEVIAPPGEVVTVTLQAFDTEPEKVLGTCDLNDSVCIYGVPTGSTVTLMGSTHASYWTYFWDDDASGGTRVIEYDVTVVASSSLAF